MQLVQVDPIGIQPFERGFALFDDVAACVVLRVEVVAHAVMDFGRQDNALPPTVAKRLADDLLTSPGPGRKIKRFVAVHVGRIDKIDPAIQRLMNNADGLLLLLPPPKIHAAQTQLADFNARSTQVSIFHHLLLLLSVGLMDSTFPLLSVGRREREALLIEKL
ncbi:protein of unknown function [Candidatus Promineifilum breve]|uniref:Uncharacterized protein n=1 Tax=Candidatus Promineifilum breve TaxID=1806508 RepID=A0A160SYS2_9CHLR|nr:protein of unknown function [Candidatus Promineifilum breve]